MGHHESESRGHDLKSTDLAFWFSIKPESQKTGLIERIF